MNKQRKSATARGIEWTDYTWNPVGGCQHGCRWTMPDGTVAECYAETVAERVAQAAYPDGFEHHYWDPDKLDEPYRLRTPSRIFLDSMSDLMGAWVPHEQIEAVLDVCRRTPKHTYQLLTKNAPRLLYHDFPPNVWLGVSAPPSEMFGKPLSEHQQRRMLDRALSVLAAIDVPVRWMSIEPLSFDIAPHLAERPPLQWMVIGAASNGPKTYQPRPQWVRNLLYVADQQAVPVFMKGNLRGNPGIDRWREDFPER